MAEVFPKDELSSIGPCNTSMLITIIITMLTAVGVEVADMAVPEEEVHKSRFCLESSKAVRFNFLQKLAFLKQIFSVGNRPQGGGHPPNGGGLLGGNGINFIQSQFQGIFADGGQGLGSFFPQGGLGSLLPQGGLFNGQGVLSLFDNGLFNGIFSSSQSNSQSGASTVPSRPITTPKPPGQDPDDIIYNDERPVHEDHDPVVPDSHYNRPGQYLVAYNPIFGEFVHDLSDFNPNRIYRQFNKELTRLVRPWAHLLGR